MITDQHDIGHHMVDGGPRDLMTARMWALTTGDLVGATTEIAREIGRKVDGDRYEGAAVALKRLEDQGLVTERELGQLEQLLDCLRDAVGKRNLPIGLAHRVRHIYLALLQDPQASPTALAIASGVNDLVAPRVKGDNDDSPQVVYLTFSEGVGVGAVTGAGVGALLGALGGGAGAAAGAAIGFVVGAVIGGGCSDETD